ncbi:phosphotransferase [Actinoplanes sp. OR16]|uniref:phosphotransferase n=1 Tax=Actinoplanes sp. OR16 TaxID=946334 RepID=UPI000FD6FA3A|nr:phosphotransferase [Actinoplanes sp. OR16]
MAGIDTPAGYTGLQRIRIGAEADTYRAWDERAGKQVALRLFHRFVSGRAEEAAFAAYCATAIGLGRHPAIIEVKAGGVTATGRPWLAFENLDGRTLEEVLRTDPPGPAEAIELVITLADALAWAHATRPPLTHGRLRAEHVLIGDDGLPRLHDFAPQRTAAPRDDITNLAALLFRALTGHPWPDADDRIISLWPGLTGLLDETLTPVPAIDSMAIFAGRLRQVVADTADF